MTAVQEAQSTTVQIGGMFVQRKGLKTQPKQNNGNKPERECESFAHVTAWTIGLGGILQDGRYGKTWLQVQINYAKGDCDLGNH